MVEAETTDYEYEDPGGDGRVDGNVSDDSEIELTAEEIPKFDIEVSQEAKLRELLRNINSAQAEFASDSLRELVKLFRVDSSGDLLRYYVRTSSKLMELQDAWKLRRGKPGFKRILRLVSEILDHPEGRYVPNDAGRITISRALDMFSKLILEENLNDVYEELKSKDKKRQRRALSLMTSIVRRGSVLADEVARSFDFKLPVFLKLAKHEKETVGHRKEVRRDAFIEFAMSFLEVGKPGLLRWVLQQKEMFSGVLRGLKDDDEENIVYVLSTLRDRVLVPESLIPPGLRSVLFGSVTLDQLMKISEGENGVLAAKIAYDVLVMVCTDPSNGLMPDLKMSSLKGNQKRLLGLMKNLKATEVQYHRDLLLAIVKGRPSLGSAYLDEFPYKCEDPSSATWIAAVSLAADLVSSIGTGICWDFLDHLSHQPSAFQDLDLQCVLRCICACPFGRLVINKGLLHSDPLVKHVTLRLLLEILKLLGSLIDALSLNESTPLKQEIQNDVRVLLPDPQVLFALLSSLNNFYCSPQTSLKRLANSEAAGKKKKKLKMDTLKDDVDIVLGVTNSANDLDLLQDIDKTGAPNRKDVPDGGSHRVKFAEVWGLYQCSSSSNAEEDENVYFHCKLLEVLKLYHRIFHTVLEVSYDFFKIIPGNPLALPRTLLQSLLSALIDHISWPLEFGLPCGSLPPCYKYLQHFINLLLYSPIREIKDESYVLARAAMLSTGAFDSNEMEVGTWFLFLPGYSGHNAQTEDQECDFFQNLSPVVVSFLCDAVSSVGNNLLKYWDRVKSYLNCSEDCKDLAVHFSPLVICVLEKCLRLLNAESATFTSPERTMISLYVSNTLKYILQTQVEANLLSSLIHQFLLEKSEDGFLAADLEKLSCEWRPMKYLFSFSKSILKGGTCNSLAVDRSALCSNSSFVSIVSEVKKMLRRGCHSELVGVSKAFYFSLVCTTPNEIIENLPSVLMISENLLGIRPLLTSLIFLDPNSFARIYKLFPDILSFSVGVGAASTLDEQKQNHCIGMTIYSLLSQAPFHVLLPAIIIGDYQDHYSRMKELLSAKLSSLTADLLLPSLMLILFWIYQANLSFRQRPSPASQSGIISAQCYALVENILQLLPVKADTCFSTVAGSSVSMQRGLHICKTLISHPAIFSSLSCPPTYGDELVEELLRDILEGAPCLSGRRASKKDQSVLSLLTVASDYLLGMCSSQNSVTVNVGCSDKIGKVFKRWVQLVFRMLRKRLDLYVETLDLTFVAPALYVILAFMRIISPFDLLGLVNWFFCRADLKDPLMWRTSNVSPFYLGFCIAGGALEMLSRCLGGAGSRLLCESKGQSSDVRLLENLYFRAVEFSTRYRLDVADVCFLNFVSASRWSEHRQDLLPLCMKMARMVASTPIEILYHCIDDINPVKSKLLLYVIEISPLHMSTFGLVLSNTLNGSSMKGTGEAYLSDEGYLMLLPAAFSYINSSLTKFGNQYAKKLGSIISFYSRILTAGFGNWRSFVDQAIFQVEYTEVLPSSSDELLDLVNKSHVGKAVHMLQYDFTLNGVSMDERLRLFLSISPCSELLDLDIRDKDSCSVEQSLNSIIRLVANICLSKILLFPRIYQNRFLLKEGDIGDDHPDTLSIRMDSARLRFLDTLVSVWQSIVKEVPSTIDTSGKKIELWLLFKYLEVFISRSISELIMEMRDALVQLDSLPFLEEIAKFSLLHRFGDLGTFKMLQCMLSSLSEGNLPTVKFLQLFLSHSQLGLTIRTASGSANVDVPGVFLKPISSILRSVIIPTEKSTTTNYSVKLETTKLLRMLFYLKSHARGSLSENDIGINSGGLLFLLLSSYGATLSEIDLKIYSLMVEIESAETSSLKLAELDYLWGSALLRTRGEQAHEFDSLPHNFMPEMEGDYRRSQFRDNLPIDPKLCIATVLHYPFERTTSDDCLSLEKFLQNNARNESKIHSAEGERITCYDPVFILRFSIHCLSMDFLDSVEFAGLGLLAIALMSMSSPDEGIRKLAYEVLGKFRDGLEKCRKKRESTRLLLLLTYLQNGVQEQWQKVPSTIAVFIAESSLILLDPSSDRYAAINKHLMQSSRINMKDIPFFHDCFWSSSVSFKKDRLWMLSLLHTGMNSEEDSRIYLKEHILEVLLSFYSSPLSDIESKGLILQILKKSVKFQNMAHYLVKNCSLFSWMSSVLSSSLSLSGDRLSGDQNIFFLNQFRLLLEVANDTVTCRGITEWLQIHALEQLSDLSFQLYKILINGSEYFCYISGSKLVEKDALLVSVLRVIVSSLKISQKRKVYRPLYTPSARDLYDLYRTVNHDAKYSPCAELALKVILMSDPPVTIFDLDQEELSSFLGWAVSTAMRSDSMLVLQQEEHSPYFRTHGREDKSEDSFLSKLMKWLTASGILGLISCKHKDQDSSFLPRMQNLDNLLSFLKYLEKECEGTKTAAGSAEILAGVIFYLQQLVGGKCEVLCSVGVALSLLLLADAPSTTGSSLIQSHGSPVSLLCSRIRRPVELSPTWKWSYEHPWVDPSSEQSDMEKMDELHASQSLLLVLSELLEKRSSDVRRLSYQDLENSGVFQWEKSVIESGFCT
ncbi:hypothetical protein Dimus_012510 [Dionaea muscipula]